MTVEPTQPQQANANPAFRRRRRKRKGSNNPQPNGQNQNAQNQNAQNQNAQNGAQPGPSNGPQAGSQPAQPGQGMAQPGQGMAMQGQAQGRPRNNGGQPGQKQGKKRFFKKQSNGSNGGGNGSNNGSNQGNGSNRDRSANGGGNPGNNQRRSKQSRQPRTFVGPMDHSYRAANGNYADAPPSTIELQRGQSNGNFNGNGNHSGYGQSYSGQNQNYNGSGLPQEDSASSAVAEPVEIPTRIYCFIDDLFFMAKIQETSRKLGVKVVFLKNDKDTMARLCEASEIERPALIVFDLNNVNAKPLTLIPKLKAKLKRTASVIGFLSHLQGDLKGKATEAGCDVVMPRSAFSQNLPNLLRRYGADEAEYIEA